MTETMYTEARKEIQNAIHLEIQSDDKDKERVRLFLAHGSGNVWDTDELGDEFDVIGFAAPFCVVTRKADGVKGSVEFQQRPRLYFNFKPYQAGR